MAGYITTASNYKKALQEEERDIFGNRTWSNLYSNVDLQYQNAEAQLNRQFGESVGQAYAAAQQQRSNILGSNLGSGYKEAMLDNTDLALNQAYDKYLSSLSESQAKLAEQTGKVYSEINTMLTERSENMAALDTVHYDYLVALDKWYQDNANTLAEGMERTKYEEFMSDPNWAKFYYTDPTTGKKRLMTREELSTPRVDPITGEYVSLYDAEGNLTVRGQDFYDQLENFYAQRVGEFGELTPPSFAGYLSKANPDLYEWANTYNPFSYSPTGTGVSQNIGAFKQMMGIDSADEEYTFLERYGGLSRTEIDNVFSDLYAELDKDTITFEDISSGIDKFKELANKIGYKDVDWDQVKINAEIMMQEYEQLKSQKSTEQGLAATGYIGGTALALVGIYLAIQGVAAYANPFGAVTGPTAGTASFAGAAAAVGAADASFYAAENNMKNIDQLTKAIENKELSIQDLYKSTLTMMTAEVQRGYTQSRIDNGGIYGSIATEQTKLGNFKSLSEWSNSSDVPMTDAEYKTYLSQVQNRTNAKADYTVKGLGLGGLESDDIRVTIDGTTYNLMTGDKVNNKRSEQFLNKLTSDNKDVPPSKGTIAVVNNAMYIYTKQGWRTIKQYDSGKPIKLHKDEYASDYNNAISAFIKSKKQ